MTKNEIETYVWQFGDMNVARSAPVATAASPNGYAFVGYATPADAVRVVASAVTWALDDKTDTVMTLFRLHGDVARGSGGVVSATRRDRHVWAGDVAQPLAKWAVAYKEARLAMAAGLEAVSRANGETWLANAFLLSRVLTAPDLAAEADVDAAYAAFVLPKKVAEASAAGAPAAVATADTAACTAAIATARGRLLSAPAPEADREFNEAVYERVRGVARLVPPPAC